MIIDGVNIESLFPNKIQFLDYSLAAPSWNRFISVMDTDYKIVNQRGSVGITNMVIRVALFDTKDNCRIMASKIVSLLDDAVVSFETNGLSYRVQISMEGQMNYKTPSLYEYQFTVQVIETMGGTSYTVVNGSSGTATCSNIGTYKAPIIITMTPASNLASVTVGGFLGHETTPITITSLHTNRRIVINGETRQILEETAVGSGVYANKFLDSDLSYFPEIAVGSTNITYTPTTGMTVSISFKPRYI